ncbi:MAG: OmpA family protein [Flavobacteriaceae bacterium]|jgi:outer membrane protein OmpA-like peptidoglycan-associated protein|nr:OmpA family protein [Flavobacteriaceae bacterium]
MKKVNYYLIALLIGSLVFTACKKDAKQDAEAPVAASETNTSKADAADTSAQAGEEATVNAYDTSFDVNSLPEASKDLGGFPYYKAPDWLREKSIDKKDLDFSKIEIYTGKGFFTVEGRVMTRYYEMASGSYDDWNEYKFEQSFTKHFESLGAKKIYEGKLSDKECEPLKKQHDNEYVNKYARLGSSSDKYVQYALKNKGKTIFFTVTIGNIGGHIIVVESGEFEQTVATIEATRIQKDLNEKGKAVLHINFDTDKATLTSDGKSAVAEITKVLQTDKNLELSINGYTDNTSNDAHNLQLSKNRAATVLNAIIVSGIDKSRLSSDGFGAKNPIADNSTEEGKAQNRRVELIKKNS